MNRDLEHLQGQSALMQHIAEELLLEGHGLSSPGLAWGKAGIALALGRYGHRQGDAYLEERAVLLLEECLLYRGRDYSLAEGWSGIGLVLMALIEEEVLEADYHELLGEQHQQLEHLCRGALACEGRVAPLLWDWVEYLLRYEEAFPPSELATLRLALVEHIEETLLGLLSDRRGRLATRAQCPSGGALVQLLLRYLVHCQSCGREPHRGLLELYATAYWDGALPSSLPLGLLLARSPLGLDELAQLNQAAALEALAYEQQPTLGELLPLLALLDLKRPEEQELLQRCHQYLGLDLHSEETLSRLLPMGAPRPSYACGLAGLLLHLLALEAPNYTPYIIL